MNKSYPINSLDQKYCKYSDMRLFKYLENCTFCKKIPLPNYKSVENQKNTFCLDCYNQKNVPKNLIEPDITQEYLLEKLVINCIFEEKAKKDMILILFKSYLIMKKYVSSIHLQNYYSNKIQFI